MLKETKNSLSAQSVCIANGRHPFHWEKLGKIISPSKAIPWLATCTGSAFACQVDESSVWDLYVTGRDEQNRSQIGRIRIDLLNPTTVLEISEESVISLGE